MRGVSLEEISAATKISIRFLQAIENEELSKLPGGIFTRSFVRTYARYLGLDEERVLADCQLAGQQKPEVDIHRITASRAGRTAPPRGLGSSPSWWRGRCWPAVMPFSVTRAESWSSKAARRWSFRRAPPAPGTNAPTTAAPVQPSTPAQPESNPHRRPLRPHPPPAPQLPPEHRRAVRLPGCQGKPAKPECRLPRYQRVCSQH